MQGDTTEYVILQVDDDGSPLASNLQLIATFRLIDDEDEQFPMLKGKLRIPPDKENDVIKRCHDGLRTIPHTISTKG
ncbi:hypothetical protein EV356DRAFT_495202 [Viridothelium virens]|uniref:Uncharacterized protein n=1 Tax=Viridothelium virens TaxID=1048519 RepID=A0A6A6GS88_VIRVR|nr:hypothetical protein EV356DRAFT_495202 [Viridothelium virens]